MGDNLAGNLVEAGRAHAARPAIVDGGAIISYATLDDLTARASQLLRARGVGEGDRVGLMFPNVPEFAISVYGALRAGAIAMPMNVMLKRREIAFQLRDSGARLLIAGRGLAEEAEAGAREVGTECLLVDSEEFARLLDTVEPDDAVRPRGGADTAVILYTSGTTGLPKGAELSHGNLASNATTFRDMLGLRPDDIVLGALPMFHSFGQTCGLHTAIVAGACLSLMPRFDARTALQLIERERVTVFEGVPTMYAALLNHPEHQEFGVSSLRLCVSGGAALPLGILRDFEAAFGCPILEGYGLTEASPVVSFNRPDRVRKPGSIGLPIDGVEMCLVDDSGREVSAGEVGEILVRGPSVMKGYWRQPDATALAMAPGGWLRTGDLATRDGDGYYFIVDRKKDVIIRGGYNVYPKEIEEVLYEHPAVHECAVVAVPHPQLGEEVGAAVVLKPGSAATPDELRDFVKERVAAYKYPRIVWLTEDLPISAQGKILKREIQLPAGPVARGAVSQGAQQRTDRGARVPEAEDR
jgi:long-chain acyl-CoA synthetase